MRLIIRVFDVQDQKVAQRTSTSAYEEMGLDILFDIADSSISIFSHTDRGAESALGTV